MAGATWNCCRLSLSFLSFVLRQKKKKETVIAWLHIDHAFIAYSFLIGGWGTTNVHWMWWTFIVLTIEHILLSCSDLNEIRLLRESHFTAQSLRVLFHNISSEKILNFLKEIYFWKNLNLSSLLVMFVSYILNVVLKLYIYQFWRMYIFKK